MQKKSPKKSTKKNDFVSSEEFQHKPIKKGMKRDSKKISIYATDEDEEYEDYNEDFSLTNSDFDYDNEEDFEDEDY
jgi:hypothetical protein